MPSIGFDSRLESAQEFNTKVKLWAARVRAYGARVLSDHVESGELLKDFRYKLVLDKDVPVWIGGVAFNYGGHGAFRHAGAGRGYKVQQGVILKTGSDRKNRKARKPLNFLDKPIKMTIDNLANIALEFHGDQALRDIMTQFDRIKRIKT